MWPFPQTVWGGARAKIDRSRGVSDRLVAVALVLGRELGVAGIEPDGFVVSFLQAVYSRFGRFPRQANATVTYPRAAARFLEDVIRLGLDTEPAGFSEPCIDFQLQFLDRRHGHRTKPKKQKRTETFLSVQVQCIQLFLADYDR